MHIQLDSQIDMRQNAYLAKQSIWHVSKCMFR